METPIGLFSVSLDRLSSEVSSGIVTGLKQYLEEDLKKAELRNSPERLTMPERMPEKGRKVEKVI